METKTEKVRALLRNGDRVGALRIAKSFRHLGDRKQAIQRGWDALQNPRFARSLGRDPDHLVEMALCAVSELYGPQASR